MSTSNRSLTIAAVRSKRQEILDAAESLGATNVRVFGSVVRNEADEASDVDLLVDIVADVHGFAYFGLLEDLRRAFEEIPDRPVHVVDSENLQRIREPVMRDAAPL